MLYTVQVCFSAMHVAWLERNTGITYSDLPQTNFQQSYWNRQGRIADMVVWWLFSMITTTGVERKNWIDRGLSIFAACDFSFAQLGLLNESRCLARWIATFSLTYLSYLIRFGHLRVQRSIPWLASFLIWGQSEISKTALLFEQAHNLKTQAGFSEGVWSKNGSQEEIRD